MKRLNTLIAVLFVVGASFATLVAQVNPPANLTATVQVSFMHPSVKLAWTADSTRNINFDVFRKSGGVADTGAFVRIAHHVRSKSLVDNGVQLNKVYTYHVVALVDSLVSLASADVEVNVVAPAVAVAKVSGVITDDVTGAPLSHAWVEVFSDTRQGGYKWAETDTLGKYSVSVAPGTWYVWAQARGHIGEYFDNAPRFNQATSVVLVNGDSLTINIGLATPVPVVTNTLAGTVKNAAGVGVKANVTIYTVKNNSSHLKAKMVRTDSLGNFTASVKLNDTVVVFVVPFDRTLAPEFYNNKVSLADADRIAVTGNVTGIDVVVDPKPVYANGISGVITDTAGNPVVGHVTAFKSKVTNPTLGDPNKYVVESDSLGVFALANLVPGEYKLMVKPQGGFRPTYFRYDGTQTRNWKNADSVVVGTDAVVSGINFIVKGCDTSGAGTVGGKVKLANGTAVAGAYVYAVNTNNEVEGYAITNKNGAYYLSGLEPGAYSVVVDKVGYNTVNAQNISINYTNSSSVTSNLTVSPDNTTDVESEGTTVTSFELSQNYPNPFNPTTNIKYAVPVASNVTLKVFNVLGAEVATLVSGYQTAGSHSVTFNASNLASGVYVYKLQAGDFTAVKKLVLMK